MIKEMDGHMGTFLMILLVGAVLFLALRSVARDKKNGGGCGCGCGHCANRGFCHPETDADETV